MDFIKHMLAGLGGDDDEDLINKVMDDAIEHSKKAAALLLERSRSYASTREGFKKDEADSYFYASLFLFCSAWLVVRHMHQGVRHTNARRGKDNEVNRLWHLIRAAFGTSDDKRAIADMRKVAEQFDKGTFDGD